MNLESSTRAAPSDAFPLSHAQRCAWISQQLTGDTPACHALSLTIDGKLDRELLQKALSIAAMEYQSPLLRLIEIDGELYQYVDTSAEMPLIYQDLRERDDPASAATEQMQLDCQTPIDLLNGNLTILQIFQTADDSYELYLRSHLIALDGYSLMTFISRISTLYNCLAKGETPNPNQTISLLELCEDELRYRQSTRYGVDRQYWESKTANLNRDNLLQPTFPAMPHAITVNGTTPITLINRIKSRSLDVGTPEPSIFMAALVCFMSLTSRNSDVSLTLPVSARTTAALQRSGGSLINWVPLFCRITNDMTLIQAIEQVQEGLMGALRHQRYNCEDIRRDLGISFNSSAYFGPSIRFNMVQMPIDFGVLRSSVNWLKSSPERDLTFFISTLPPDDPKIGIEANPSRYNAGSAQSLRDRFVTFLSIFVDANPLNTIGELGAQLPVGTIPLPTNSVHVDASDAPLKRDPRTPSEISEELPSRAENSNLGIESLEDSIAHAELLLRSLRRLRDSLPRI